MATSFSLPAPTTNIREIKGDLFEIAPEGSVLVRTSVSICPFLHPTLYWCYLHHSTTTPRAAGSNLFSQHPLVFFGFPSRPELHTPVGLAVMSSANRFSYKGHMLTRAPDACNCQGVWGAGIARGFKELVHLATFYPYQFSFLPFSAKIPTLSLTSMASTSI